MADEVVVNAVPDSVSVDEKEHIQEMADKVDGVPVKPVEAEGTKEPMAEGIGIGEEGSLANPDKEGKEGAKDNGKSDEDSEEGKEGKEDPSKGEVFSEKELADYTGEVQKNGTLSEESIQQIVKKGIPKQLVKDYLEGIKAQSTIQTQQAEATKQTLYDLAEGEQGYQSMQTWAKDNLSPAEKEAFNTAVYSGNVEMAKLAVSGLHARYVANNPTNSSVNLIGGSPQNVTNSSNSYASWAEVKHDMARPEYKKDPVFQAQVKAKMGRSRSL